MASQSAPSRTLQCVVVTPEKAVLDEPADFVALPMFDGELGVLPGRRPMIGRLGVGELRVKHGTVTKRFLIDGGFAQIRGNTVSVLTPKAQPADELTAQAAEQALETAKAATGRTPEQLAAKARAQARARAQLQILRRLSAPSISLQ